MCTVLLPPGDNPIAVNKYIKKICPVGAELFYMDGQMDRQTDMAKLIGGFDNFANMPKKLL